MAEDLNTETIEIQKVGVPGKKVKVSKYAIIIAAGALILLAGAGTAVYQARVKAEKYPATTGAIVDPVNYAPNDPDLELNNLLNKGDFSESGFSVKHVTRSTSIAVFLDSPYDQSQLKFVAWLIANGFGDIPKEKIVYFHNP